MNNSSTLANATVTKNGGALNFLNTSSGGQASVTLNGSSQLQFSNYTGPGTTIGSLAGSGTVNLTDISNTQNKSLTIGGNNQSTTFSGLITGGGSIVKQGSGTLTLSGTSTYSGGTTINGGALSISSDANLGNSSGPLTFGGGTLQTTASFNSFPPDHAECGRRHDRHGVVHTLTPERAISGDRQPDQDRGRHAEPGRAPTATAVVRRCRPASCQGTTTSLRGSIVNNANVDL